MTGRWFSPGTLASSTNKTGRHDITGILLKVVLNTINHKPILRQYTRTYGHKMHVFLRQKSPVRTNIYLIHYSDWHFFVRVREQTHAQIFNGHKAKNACVWITSPVRHDPHQFENKYHIMH